MARAIYREWFVHFRYPGHRDATLVDSPVGPIPEQWSVECVADLSSAVIRGIAPKYADDGSWVVINQKCIRDERVSLGAARRQERAVPEAKCVRFGDVLINSTGVGTLGRVALYRGGVQHLTVDSHVTIARPLDASLNPWYGLTLVSKKTEFERLGSGSTGQTELSRADIGALKVVVPRPDVRTRFADRSWPLLSQADELLQWNLALTKIRDLLLPRLVSGQIDVSALDLDALIENSVA
jgi:type I restriction enzyme S subunit